MAVVMATASNTSNTAPIAFDEAAALVEDHLTAPPEMHPADFIVADSEVAAPDPNPKLHIDPFAAAKEIRALAKELQGGIGDKNYQHVVNYIDYYQTKIETSNLPHLKTHLAALALLIEQRKVVAARAEMKQVEHYVSRIEQNASSLKEQVKVLKPPKQAHKSKLERLHILAQSLPTVKNIPLDPAENILRAMATILKNGGYVK